MHLDEATFVVTDTETTGTHSDARIIEIAAVKLRGGEVVDRFDRLVNPGRAIPRKITRLTGITTGMVFEKPPAEEVLPAYMEFLGNGVFVAHNLSFDRRMIDGELGRMGAPKLDTKKLCTVRLARRLLHELPSRSLEALIRHYGIRVDDRHRALADAEATSHVLRRLISHFSFQVGSTELDELLRFQYSSYKEARPAMRHVERIRGSVLPEIPERPGVYVMKDGDGAVLYVGKAKSLRSRVRSYFQGIEGQGARIKKLVREVRAIDWEETESEVEALFRESRLIKEVRPRYNRAQLSYGPFVFLRLEGAEAVREGDGLRGEEAGGEEAERRGAATLGASAEPEAAGESSGSEVDAAETEGPGPDVGRAPTITISPRVAEDGADYYGPITSRRDANRVLGLIHQAFGLTVTRRRRTNGRSDAADRPAVPVVTEPEAPPAEQLRRVRGFLRGEDAELLDRLEERMQEASEEQAYEEASWYRDELERLQRLFERQMRMRGPVRSFSGVMVERDEAASSATFFVLAGGRVVDRHACPTPVAGLDREYLRHLVEDHIADPRAAGEHEKAEVEDLRILLQWMMQNEDRVRFVRRRAEPVDVTVGRIVRATRGEAGGEPGIESGDHTEIGEHAR